MRIVLGAPRRLRDAHELEHLDRSCRRLIRSDALVGAHRLGDLVADGVHRVQRGHRLLEDHRDLVAADALHLALFQACEVAPVEDDLALVGDVAGIVHQPHHRKRGHGLAAPRLAHDAERVPGLDLEVDAVDGPDRPAVRVEPRPQVLDAQERRHAGAGMLTAMCFSSAAEMTSDSRVCSASSSSLCSTATRCKLLRP